MTNAWTWVVQVFFNKAKDVPDCPNLYQTDQLFGFPLWKPCGEPIVRWAIDWVSATEERWVVFGPFNSQGEANQLYYKLLDQFDRNSLLGYRLFGSHEFGNVPGTYTDYKNVTMGGTYPCQMWTDG